MSTAFFEVEKRDDVEVLLPLEQASSGWGQSQMRGMAMSGALARAAERAAAELGRSDLRPVRWTLDLLRAARMGPSSATATIVREGRRLCLVEAALHQGGRMVARASALYLRGGDVPDGEVWSASHRTLPPPDDLLPVSADARVYYSEGVGWSADAAQHQTGSRKQIWQHAIPVVAGELVSPFQFAASVADIANTVTNWGSCGLTYINADVTVLMSRLPSGSAMGVAASDRFAHDGVSIGSTILFDRDGPFGTATVSALANAAQAVDVSSRADSMRNDLNP